MVNYGKRTILAGLVDSLKRFILWDYPRASWQYDVKVGLILLFIFVTPRAWFRDQPRPTSVVKLPSEHGTDVFWVEPDVLDGVPEPDRVSQVAQALEKAHGGRKNARIVRLEPIFDAESEIRGYMAYVRP